MADTAFVNGTIVQPEWCNDVNDDVYGNNQRIAPLGSVGAPSYAVKGGLTTGMWFPSTTTIAWSVGGAEGVSLTSTGLGIGGTPTRPLDLITSQHLAFRINGTGSGVYQVFANSGTVFGYIGSRNQVTGSGDSTDLAMRSDGSIYFATGGSSERFVITSGGLLYGTALHNNAGSVTGTTNQYIASGTYTPAVSQLANIGTSASAQASWLRVGNIVYVSGSVTIDPTSVSILTAIALSLPIASNFANANNANGNAQRATTAVASLGAYIQADSVNDRVEFSYLNDTDVASRTWVYHYSYEVL